MSDQYWGDYNNSNAYGWNAQQQQYQQPTNNSLDMGWGQFDYSEQSQPQQAPSAPPTNYYAQQANAYSTPYNGNMFVPGQQPNSAYNAASGSDEDYENEPPLLEELGINFSHIREKTVAVLNPIGTASADVIADQDLAGPLVFCLLFGAALLLHGKLHFGYIYGIGGVGCVGMYLLMNLMAAEHSISFTCTASVLGYCLLPMAILSIGLIGYSISALAVLWCSNASSKLFITALQMDHQRLLVAYPCALMYSVFALLAIF